MHSASLALLALAFAGAPRADELPAPLREWTRWVLHSEKDAGCPFLHASDTKSCTWPGKLTLTLDEKGGRFTQTVQVFAETWRPLPGDARRWPQNVRVDGMPAMVVPAPGPSDAVAGASSGRPAVKLATGEHTVAGEFLWDALPEALELPADTALLALTVRGKPVPLPNRDEAGRVFLQKEGAAPESENLDITVHRKVTDEIPLRLTTRLRLQVSGKSREVLLGRALPPGFVPMALASGVPVRLEADGRLRLQLRPGTWQVELVARSEGPVAALKRPEPQGPWAEDEIWVFEARPSLREVLVEGVEALDPAQTTLPDEWKRLPAFAMGAAEAMALTERRRGDSDPAPDQLELDRTLWLDFDGGGYTVSDRIRGQLNRSWRLEVQPGTDLGRVVAAGADQSITRLTPGSSAGVELRQGQLALEAESRIPHRLGALPAVSWNADFKSVSARLKLPPGWRLFAVAGADKVPGTWVEQWTLLDIFLVLIIALAVGKLFGRLWGALALLTLILGWQEPGIPQYAWLAVLACEALVRLLPANRLRTLARVGRLAAWGALVLLALDFAVDHVRHGMYPALAQPRSLGGMMSYSEYSSENSAQYQRSVGSGLNLQSGGFSNDYYEQDARPEEEAQELKRDRRVAKKMKAQAPAQQLAQPRSFNVRDYDKNATVQTGPGLPRWDWQSLEVRFAGPVQRTQTLRLWLLGPRTNFALAGLRVLLLAALVLCVLGFPGSFWPQALRRRLKASGAAALALMGVLAASPAARAEASGGAIPPPEMLQELRSRLLEKPACAPTCASSPRLALEAKASTLRVRLEVLSGASTAIPLPGNGRHWVPETVVVDGRATAGVRRSEDGQLWLALGEGAHQVVLEGPLPPRDTVQIALPLKPHRVEATLDGWTLDGLHEDGLADDNLQLSRKAQETERTGALQAGTLSPFVQVERTLVLGLQWTVETRVERLTPTGGAVMLEVPLLPGESVTTGDLRVQDGKALVSMSAAATEVRWSSLLQATPSLALEAPASVPWVEVWRLDVSPIWHVELSGIPIVHPQDESGARLPEWRPWPGEKVLVAVHRPESVQGQTLTVDQGRLSVAPGLRATDATFRANMRSSRGGLHVFTLPEDAQLQSVTVNGAVQPIRQEGRKVSIPLVPGSQGVELAWRQASGMSTWWRTPEFGPGTPLVNAELEVEVPEDRWVLALAGPRMGPAVLFWSFLLVLLAVSIGLARTRWTPLSTAQWLLLAVGLSQAPIVAIAFVFGWLLLLGHRERTPAFDSRVGFNLRQLALAALTVAALGILAASVYDGLLGAPEMQVQGNGSDPRSLRWFQDRTAAVFPQAAILSVPMLVYRAAMLAWSLWAAFRLLGWLKWGWQAFAKGGVWRPKPKVVAATVPTSK